MTKWNMLLMCEWTSSNSFSESIYFWICLIILQGPAAPNIPVCVGLSDTCGPFWDPVVSLPHATVAKLGTDDHSAWGPWHPGLEGGQLWVLCHVLPSVECSDANPCLGNKLLIIYWSKQTAAHLFVLLYSTNDCTNMCKNKPVFTALLPFSSLVTNI